MLIVQVFRLYKIGYFDLVDIFKIKIYFLFKGKIVMTLYKQFFVKIILVMLEGWNVFFTIYYFFKKEMEM